MYPGEKQQRLPYEEPHPYEDVPPPSYESHYASDSAGPSTSTSASQQSRRPPTPPEKPKRQDTTMSVDDLYTQPTKGMSDDPIGTVSPFPNPAFAESSKTSSPTEPNNLARSSSLAQFPVVPGPSQPQASAPPPSFHRPAPHEFPYIPFPPIALFTSSKALADGFPRMPPISTVEPHPFATHDVREEDWNWFLSQVKGAVGSEGKDFTSIPGVTPVATHLAVGMGLGRLVNMGIEAHVKSKKSGPMAEVFHTWNRNFFHPRRLDVILARGRFCYSGPNDGLPPDMVDNDSFAYDVYNQGGHVSDDDYSSDDSHPERTARRKEKRAAKNLAKKERKTQRRSQRMERKDFINASENQWRLIVVHKPEVIA
ncbi:hypothetical protein EIP91_010000 [Steccherinum ochraceum]|uniref:Uncharacterized protein n=1 Tax=Steccherinum ochraceum TaxID=92696 RepID=A0A4R0RM89_9APHY|nr:hypothetical protein EIP91_010000 [Steccherinum ochraceum]